MEVTLRYGKTGLKVQVPDGNLSGILRMRPVPILPDRDAAVADALHSPLGTASLETLARGRKNAVIVVCDVTRPVPNPLLLRHLLPTLHRAGLSHEQITILVATGLHRPNEGAELEEMIGEEFARDYDVFNHEGRDDESHAYLGETNRGTPIYIDRRYADADLKILTGLVEPHLMAGYSGGRKVVCPGLGSWRTVSRLHSPVFMEHPACTMGHLEDNPLHHELVEIAERAGADFILNVTMDESRNLTGVFAGDLKQAHLAGVRQVDQAARMAIEEPADVVLTTSAGYPLDTTFYQSVKGVKGALPAVKPGGSIVLAASLSEGIGGPEFQNLLFRYDHLSQLMEGILHSESVEIDQWQIEELGIARRRAEVIYYSDGLEAETLRRCHVEAAESVEEGVERALARHGPNARLLVIPEGPYVMPTAAS